MEEMQEKRDNDVTGCAFEDCSCQSAGVVHEGKAYCSQGCADGEGCDHADCGCGDS